MFQKTRTTVVGFLILAKPCSPESSKGGEMSCVSDQSKPYELVPVEVLSFVPINTATRKTSYRYYQQHLRCRTNAVYMCAHTATLKFNLWLQIFVSLAPETQKDSHKVTIIHYRYLTKALQFDPLPNFSTIYSVGVFSKSIHYNSLPSFIRLWI